MDQINIGDLVEATYNSGKYIGKVIEDKRNFWLVEIVAVSEHPMQGDLHNRGQVEGVAFHERKALAYREKANIRKMHTTLYKGEVPNYIESLKRAVEAMKQELSKADTPFNKLSLEKLADLETYFYNKLYEK